MLSTMACSFQKIINFNKKVSNSMDLASTEGLKRKRDMLSFVLNDQ
jgi:hypothetical protein